MDKARVEKLREILGEIKRSETLTKFFVEQRDNGRYHSWSADPWTDTMEQLVMEMLLSRAEDRMNKKFERSDAYRHILERVGLNMTALDAELRGPMKG